MNRLLISRLFRQAARWCAHPLACLTVGVVDSGAKGAGVGRARRLRSPALPAAAACQARSARALAQNFAEQREKQKRRALPLLPTAILTLLGINST
ncbi:Hypothetical predicted protein [Cloeon dipterum]|uniref:Uncharacterized protein n=1 Tax=Cloeon dipterum TaxID=197152 RepID=A0A8S1DQM7_9INSE|nr:Hypothetical predicted protein [Cloeon dipterum]